MSKPLLTVLTFSGGKQSSCLLWMLLNGDIPRPEHLIVLTANPGMENSNTYRYVDRMFDLCWKAGIEAIKAKGPNLYEDLVGLSQTDKKRFDTPPYWTLPAELVKDRPDLKTVEKKQGRLLQGCTKHYKIAPMDRAIRIVLERDFGISRVTRNLGVGIVEKWIGFSYSEVIRMSDPLQKYVVFRYPLIEMKMTNEDVLKYFKDRDLELPPRSVCNACFANGLGALKEMHDERPEDWKGAVAVDDSVRDWKQIGVKHPTFVSKACLSLRELAARNFDVEADPKDQDGWSCDSGYCFT